MTDIVPAGNSLPAPYSPQAEISAEDIALPRVKIGQHQSDAVQDGLIKPGQIFSALGKDDNEPVVLHTPNTKGDEGLLFHVLGVRKGWSLQVDGELETWADNDPTRPDDANRTYDYAICLPEVDADLPYKFLFTRTATGAAKKVNLLLTKAAASGPTHAVAFRVTTLEKKRDQYRWFIPVVTRVEADPAHTAVAEELLGLVQGGPTTAPAATAEPAI